MTQRSFEQLRGLDCFDRIKEMLKYNYSHTEVAKYIQETEGEYTHVKQDSLRRVISDFYNQKIPDIEKIKHANPDKIKEYEERLDEEIDVIREYKEMYYHQKSRVENLRSKEVDTGKIRDDTGDEIDRATKIIEKISEHRKDIGLDQRNLGTIRQETLTADLSQKATGVDNNNFIMDPNRRQKVVTFFERLQNADEEAFEEVVEDMAEDVIDAEYDEVEEGVSEESKEIESSEDSS